MGGANVSTHAVPCCEYLKMVTVFSAALVGVAFLWLHFFTYALKFFPHSFKDHLCQFDVDSECSAISEKLREIISEIRNTTTEEECGNGLLGTNVEASKVDDNNMTECDRMEIYSSDSNDDVRNRHPSGESIEDGNGESVPRKIWLANFIGDDILYDDNEKVAQTSLNYDGKFWHSCNKLLEQKPSQSLGERNGLPFPLYVRCDEMSPLIASLQMIFIIVYPFLKTCSEKELVSSSLEGNTLLFWMATAFIESMKCGDLLISIFPQISFLAHPSLCSTDYYEKYFINPFEAHDEGRLDESVPSFSDFFSQLIQSLEVDIDDVYGSRDKLYQIFSGMIITKYPSVSMHCKIDAIPNRISALMDISLDEKSRILTFVSNRGPDSPGFLSMPPRISALFKDCEKSFIFKCAIVRVNGSDAVKKDPRTKLYANIISYGGRIYYVMGHEILNTWNEYDTTVEQCVGFTPLAVAYEIDENFA